MDRKKEELSRRVAVSSPSEISSGNSPPVVSNLQLLLPGMIAFFTGAKSEEEIMEISEKCCHVGRDIYRGDFSGRKFFQRFPHASFEPKKECSSR
jgi:hypothetical protein